MNHGFLALDINYLRLKIAEKVNGKRALKMVSQAGSLNSFSSYIMKIHDDNSFSLLLDFSRYRCKLFFTVC